ATLRRTPFNMGRATATPRLYAVVPKNSRKGPQTKTMVNRRRSGRSSSNSDVERGAPKGHFPEELHIALVELISGLLPAGTPVVLLGDGECDGTRFQQTLQQAGWSSAHRTAAS